ncbi:MAG: Hsp20/alpha crystallin family protein [Saprospiraceae bacterium]|nr:Hsp20/alpha crystallin family protein [Saprospiraceae bacterium]
MWRPNIKNRAFDRMGERYARLIDPDHFLGRSAFDIRRNWDHLRPPVNIVKKEGGKIFEIELAIPGFRKEDIEIMVKDDIMTVKGEKSRREKGESSEYVLEEFDFDTFERRFLLSPSISHEKITATYRKGILLITFTDVPKEEERASQKVKVA